MSDKSPVDLSIVVPVLNEEATVRELLDRLLALPGSNEVVVSDNGSTDGSAAILAEYGDRIQLITHTERTGKGRSIRAALPRCRGKVVVVQDADLEYLPEEIPSLVAPILSGEVDFVYGNRFWQGLTPGMALPNKLVNVLLVLAVAVLFGKRIHDEATCYKAFRREDLQAMQLQCERFEFCPEVTAKAFRMKLRFREVPITYRPRTVAAGKKIRWTDAPEAFWTLLRHRFSKLSSR